MIKEIFKETLWSDKKNTNSEGEKKNTERANSSSVSDHTHLMFWQTESNHLKIQHLNKSNCSQSIGTVAYNCYHKLNIQWNLHLVVGPASHFKYIYMHLFTPFTPVIQMIAI